MGAPIETAEGYGQYLTFSLADEEYGLDILRVREIIRYEAVTFVPRVPPFIRGVINLRGSVVPVVDLAVKFGLEPGRATGLTCIVIVEVDLDGERTVMGIVADRVSQVLDLAPRDIEPPPTLGTLIQVEYLVGLGKLGPRFVLILDIDRVLSSSELLAAAALPEAIAEEAAEGGAAATSEVEGVGAVS